MSPLPIAESRSPPRISHAARGRSGRNAGALRAGMRQIVSDARGAARGRPSETPRSLPELADCLADFGRALETLLRESLESRAHLAARAAALGFADQVALSGRIGDAVE